MFKFSSAEETCHLSPLNMCARQNRSYIHDLLRGSLLVTAPDSWSKGCEFESRQKQRENFLLRVIFACWLLFDVRCTPMLPQWHVKKKPVILPEVQMTGYTLTRIHPWPNEVGVGWLCRCPGIVWEPIRENELTRNLSGERRGSHHLILNNPMNFQLNRIRT